MDIWRLSEKFDNLKLRAEILRLTRSFLYSRGYLEIETPALAECPIPEACIEPIETTRGRLLPSPELYMKQLLAAGSGDIYQICHSFRKNEKGRQHREEFTLLEYYRVGGNYLQLAAETEALVIGLSEATRNSSRINYQGMSIDLSPPWRRLSVAEAYMSACGWNPITVDDPERFDLDLATGVAGLSRERPLILYDFPAGMASLARLKPEDPALAERTEIFIGGLEIANIFSELTDPGEQRKRFEIEIKSAEKQNRSAALPEEFLESLKSLPEAAGGALGIDRLVMLFCDAASIDEVVAF